MKVSAGSAAARMLHGTNDPSAFRSCLATIRLLSSTRTRDPIVLELLPKIDSIQASLLRILPIIPTKQFRNSSRAAPNQELESRIGSRMVLSVKKKPEDSRMKKLIEMKTPSSGEYRSRIDNESEK